MSHRPILGLEDAFGTRARDLRVMQGRLLNVFADAGFAEVIPPVLERPETLKSGAGRFLADQTVVFSDPADAGLLAVRPDMTPQIARIAATRLLSQDILRLCYSGTVILARPESRHGSRQQWQTGVECLGVAGVDGDVEVMRLAVRCMQAASFKAPVLQIGHIGLLKSLVAASAIPLERWTEMLSRRSPDDMAKLVADGDLDGSCQDALLVMASGKAEALWLQGRIGKINTEFDAAAADLQAVVAQLEDDLNGVILQVDAAVMPRFLYHSGVVFAGFAEGVPYALLHGGRYDAMMAAHGRDMPATGFSLDLWAWLDSGVRVEA
ncbi:MAG: ATP phosphoribosyltransferase regulatory subunit [Mariprofundaceae bacterium]|nr:ATP phosphoribosyltransferase regulatory subunit [Mariprofundaceae bacterium]